MLKSKNLEKIQSITEQLRAKLEIETKSDDKYNKTFATVLNAVQNNLLNNQIYDNNTAKLIKSCISSLK